MVAKRQKTRASAQRPGSSVPSKTLYENLEELPHAHLSPPIMAFNGATPRKEPLKGRRKFIADLKDATDACANGFEVQGLRLSGVFLQACISCMTHAKTFGYLVLQLLRMVKTKGRFYARS